MAIKPKPINSNVGRYFDMMRDINAYGSTLNPNAFATDMGLARQRKQEYEDFLGKTDYSGKLKESEDLAKLQLGLALAQRGFAAMGAQPRRGESAIGVLGRTLAAPLAGDLSTVAGRLMQQRQAVKLAEQQEERQLKLSALTAAASEGKDRRALAIKLMEEAGEDSLDSKVRYLIRPKSEGDGYEFVPQKGPNKKMGRTQLRLQKGTGEPYNIQSQLFQRVLPGQVVVSADEFKKYGLSSEGTGTGKTASLGAVDYKLFWTSGPNKGKPYTVNGRTPVYATATKGEKSIPIGSFVEKGGKGRPFSLEDLKNKNLEARRVVKPTAATTPRGVKDPKFISSFGGMLFDLGRLQRTLGIGKTALKIVPGNLMVNPDLKPGDKFPFIRVDGLPLTELEQKSLKTQLAQSYLSYYDRIKAGATRADIGAEWAQAQLTKSYEDLGLKRSPAGTQQPREAVTDAATITERYKNAAQGFRTNPVAQETIRKLPFGVDRRNMNAGVGRLVFYDWFGVDFGETTTAPAPNAANRPQKIAGMNRQAIEDRVIAEHLSNSVSPLGNTLSPSTANTRPKQMAAVGKPFDEAKKKLTDAAQSGRGRQVGEAFGKTLNAVALLDRVDALAHHSGALGIIRGPLEQIGQSKLGISFSDWYKTDKGKEATKLLIAELPVLKEFIARELLKGAGEQRISRPDLEGAQRTLTTMSENEVYSADKLRSLRRYLVNSIKHTASYIGSFHLPDETQKEAARLGLDLKSIKGVNLVYSPYLADSNYAVTKQPVPRYSRAYQDQLRNEGIFTYVAEGLDGQDSQFRLIITDADGNPRQNTDGSYQTGLYNATEIKKQEHKDMVDFNRNFLMQTYRLDRN